MTIQPVNPDTATGRVAELLAGAKAKLGMVPNMFRVIANAPKVLDGYFAFSGAVGNTLNGKAREQLAIALAGSNDCGYCLSAHTALGRMAGVSGDDLRSAQSGSVSDPKTQAMIDFALEVNRTHGENMQSGVAAARDAGLSDEELLEIIANVALNIFTNAVNGVAETEIDFPKVEIIKKAA
ncbi:carboxymuconolactone decarboxylase family protein [Micavibrio aeruginosavorus]|uniref:carboxymuconolactone decarboxylase family protein n=1 Tax=Micavibrio aeruginosavorus TaxID=349221 RepID=UPI003F4AEC04